MSNPAPAAPPPIPAPRTWTPVHTAAANGHIDKLRQLRQFDPKVWSPITSRAVGGLLGGAGLGYMAHRLMGAESEDPKDRERRARRRTLLMGLGGVGGGLLGANTAWKHYVAPHLQQNLATSFFDPQTAFAKGMRNNYHENLRTAGRKLDSTYTTSGIPGIIGNFGSKALEAPSGAIHRVGLGRFSPQALWDKTWFKDQPETLNARLAARDYKYNPAGFLPAPPSEETLRQMYHLAPLERSVGLIDSLQAHRSPAVVEYLQQLVENAKYQSANLDKTQPWIRDRVSELTQSLQPQQP